MSRCLFEVILAVKRKCQCNEEQIREELGLSQAEFHGLLVLASAREMTGCEFARRMGLSPSRASRVVDRLVIGGYVARRSDAEDRRAIQICLTVRGKRMGRRIVGRMEACEDRICGNLDGAEVRHVRRALELLESVL
jgi:DNA-binding MarR family transcriptional regulator